jgi:ElaB/YqjD/DUF883 family membrane-anchored ribosome-binding protein
MTLRPRRWRNVDKTRAEDHAAAFRRAFDAVSPLIREEWPDVDAASLAATEGDFDKVVALVAERTERTRVGVRRQLSELLTLARAVPKSEANGARVPAERARPAFDQMDDVLAAIRRLEAFASDEAKRISDKVVPAAETRIRQSLWTSLLLALGLGLILGLWLNGGRRHR